MSWDIARTSFASAGVKNIPTDSRGRRAGVECGDRERLSEAVLHGQSLKGDLGTELWIDPVFPG